MATEAQTCALVAINNAGRPGLNRLYTKYYRLTTNCPSTFVESPLQIHPFYAKQTQFAKSRNERKFCYNNEL